MNGSIEFTPKELYQISLYKDPAGLARRATMRSLFYVIPSIGAVAGYLVTGELAYAAVGYAILLYRIIYRMTITRRGLEANASIIRKYEAQLDKMKNAC